MIRVGYRSHIYRYGSRWLVLDGIWRLLMDSVYCFGSGCKYFPLYPSNLDPCDKTSYILLAYSAAFIPLLTV
jgi:hypothetical protein